MSRATLLRLAATLSLLLPACDGAERPALAGAKAPDVAPTSTATTATVATAPADAAPACRARIAEALASSPAPGAPAFDAARVEILGRARGEPLVFVREPKPTAEEGLEPRLRASLKAFEKDRKGGRISSLRKRHHGDPKALRALLLREGYAYSSDPADALALATDVTLPDLFEEETILLQRGHETRTLKREKVRKEVRYVDADGKPEALLFGDRVGLTQEELAAPLHRDLAALADVEGFERARLVHVTESSLVAEVRYGDVWVKALLVSEGAKLSLGCLEEEGQAAVGEGKKSFLDKTAVLRRAMTSIRGAVSHAVDEALRFDRPEAEPDHFRDGILRSQWVTAYLQGRESFTFEGKHYAVFDTKGRAWPPEVCVDLVLDTFERASGTWYRPKGEAPARVTGRLDFQDIIPARPRGVIALGKFAESKPELFDYRKFEGAERIPFAERTRFFQFLVDHAEEVRPGDIVAIQGEKRDGYVHQHAIFVERVDPLTGFPFGLADQMKRPRRRTWEGIMAEAPKRSLFYRARPREEIWAKVDPGE